MKTCRSLVLLLCMALPWLPGAAAHAAQPAAKAEAVPGKVTGKSAPAVKATAKPAAKPASKQAASKSRQRQKVSKAVAKPLPKPKLDLSLPRDMVNQLEPQVSQSPPARKALLPALFPDETRADAGPFQLNGRLISNEMDLQMRNDSRRDVEGAALDFQFRN